MLSALPNESGKKTRSTRRYVIWTIISDEESEAQAHRFIDAGRKGPTSIGVLFLNIRHRIQRTFDFPRMSNTVAFLRKQEDLTWGSSSLFLLTSLQEMDSKQTNSMTRSS
ncbi:hypothetical protein CEXT_257871 [Caerostris extrusa]|uniref:Uncharacterized protein n=1 Tax=Caerostris extrusa TaxID=172846 RepID=A0AAV4TLM0_CAEEX|nr:hypothetical protein CEXT_257871 [Caerostris extrusa]